MINSNNIKEHNILSVFSAPVTVLAPLLVLNPFQSGTYIEGTVFI